MRPPQLNSNHLLHFHKDDLSAYAKDQDLPRESKLLADTDTKLGAVDNVGEDIHQASNRSHIGTAGRSNFFPVFFFVPWHDDPGQTARSIVTINASNDALREVSLFCRFCFYQVTFRIQNPYILLQL